MNMMEMVLALFAVIFFTTISMNYNQKIVSQNDLLINATQYVQATQLAHTVLDEVDAKLFSKQLVFFNIKTIYANVDRTIDLQFPGDRYALNIRAVDCDSLGVPLVTAVVKNIYVRIQVSVTTPGLKVPVLMQRIYTKTYLNL